MRAHFTRQVEIDLEEIGNYIALDNPRRDLSSPSLCVRYRCCDLLCKGLAVPLFNDAKNRALVRIT